MLLTDVLTPVGVEALLREYLGERYLVIPGDPHRFEHLVSWPELNEVLTALRLDDGRVVLVRNGEKIPATSYTQPTPSGRHHQLHGAAVRALVLRGATLIVNHVDTLLPEVRQLVESLEDTFETHVSANLYAGWRTDQGFDVHWDGHDTLIVQVTGRKNWKVWHPTRLHPHPDDRSAPVPPPVDEPVWQGVLEAGHVLYMPRGWWHVAWPCDEPSLHVTFGVRHPIGADLLHWVVRRLKSSVDVRNDIPYWKSRDEQRAWLRELRTACCDALHDRVIEDYLDDVASRLAPRPVVHLPEGTSSISQQLHVATLLRLARVRRLRFREVDGVLRFKSGGREWGCDERLRPALALLQGVRPCRWQAMLDAVDGSVRPILRAFVTGLIAGNVIWLEQGSAPVVQQDAAPVAFR